MSQTNLSNSKLFIVLVAIIGIMGAWILKLGSDLVEARNRIPPPIVAPTVTLQRPSDLEK